MTQKPSHLIDGQWIEGEGPQLISTDPATGRPVWTGRAAVPHEVDRAVSAARSAFASWADCSVEQRVQPLRVFEQQLKTHRDDLAQTISRETGKPEWEALSEVDTMIAKIGLSTEVWDKRCSTTTQTVGDATGATRYKPHGVVAILGPFNLPGHLPNGQIVPALLAGNTVVFKPSELTPAVAQRTVELWCAAGLPPGVLSLVQGDADTGRALAGHTHVDGLFFTGSYAVGRALSKAFADRPEKILALEMGGNNPLIVHGVVDQDAAAYLTIQSAYITAGQRCTCAR